MSIIFLLTVYVALFFVQKNKYLDAVSNITLLLFNLYWFFSLALSTIGLNNFFIPQTSTIIMLLLGVCLFNAGFYTLKINKGIEFSINKESLAASFDVVLSNVWMKLLVTMTCIYIIYIFTMYYDLLVLEQVTGAEIREQKSDGTFDLEVPFSSFFSFIYPWLIPIVRVLFCYSILYKRNLYTVILFVLLFGYSSLSFGRMMYIIAIMPVILIIGFFQVREKRIEISKKQRVFFLGLLIALFAALSFISTLRMGALEDSSMNEGTEMVVTQITDYSSGAIVGFDAALKDNYVDKVGGYKYGMVTLWPFVFPFTAISHVMGGYQYATGDWAYTSDYIERAYPKVRSDGGTWNGLFTWNVLFYNDFGFVGIVLFNFLFGLLMRFCIKKVYENQSFLSVVICSIFFIITVLSPTKLWGYENLFGVVLFIFIFVEKVNVVNKHKPKKRVRQLNFNS